MTVRKHEFPRAWTLCALLFVATSAFCARPIMSVGDSFSVLLDEHGTVHAVGINNAGQLGNASNSPSTVWVNVSSLTGVVQIASGASHTLALKADGTVWAWGLNFDGQLGLGTHGAGTDQNTPQQISSLTNVVAVAAGSNFSLALLRNGTVKSWGNNDKGQLGNGNNTPQYSPVAVSSLTGVSTIAAGALHGLAVLNDGTLRAWGYDHWGQLGDGSTGDQSTPVTVVTAPSTPLTSVVRAVGGGFDSYAVLGDGTVRAWGANDAGELGNGSTNSTANGVPVTVLTAVSTPLACAVELAAGRNYALATTCTGTVVGWGSNDLGQLGRGTTTASEPFALSTSPAYASAGVFANGPANGTPSSFLYLPGGPATPLALGQFLGFGNNASGQLGTVGGNSQYAVPTAIALNGPGAKLGKRSNFRNTGSPADVFWSKTDGTNAIWDFNGAAANGFAAYFPPGVDTSWHPVATGDVSGDSISDIVWFQPALGQVAIWLMSDPATIATATFPAAVGPGSPWTIQAVGDMDGDSVADILWRNGSTGEVFIWYMKSDGTIDQTLSLGNIPLSFQIRALADVDGDWIKDIVWLQASTGQVVIWNMHPNGSYTAWFPLSVGAGSGWDIYRVGDFDGDGREDLMWRKTDGTTVISYMAGPAVAASQFLPGVPLSAWRLEAVGDYDGDGHEDLLWTSLSDGNVLIWRMHGRGISPTVEGVAGTGGGWQSTQ